MDDDGHVVLNGMAYPEAPQDKPLMFTRKYSSAGGGTLLWDDAYAGPNGDFAYGFDVTIDSRGDVIASALVQGDNSAIAIRKLRR